MSAPEADDGDQPADDRCNIGTVDAEGDAGDHGVRHAAILAGLAEKIGKQLHDADADEKAQEHFPAGQAQREQRCRENIAADAVNIRHPEGKDVVPGPVLRSSDRPRAAGSGKRRQILVVKLFRIAAFEFGAGNDGTHCTPPSLGVRGSAFFSPAAQRAGTLSVRM